MLDFTEQIRIPAGTNLLGTHHWLYGKSIRTSEENMNTQNPSNWQRFKNSKLYGIKQTLRKPNIFKGNVENHFSAHDMPYIFN